MKLLLDGMTIEIKVTPDGSKNADRKATAAFIDELTMVYAHAANFVRGNGMQVRGEYYYDMACQIDAALRGNTMN